MTIKPQQYSTRDTFASILAAMFEDVRQNNRLLNRVIAHEQVALAIMLDSCKDMKDLGKNLDYCIETHIHGDVSLANDVEEFIVTAALIGEASRDSLTNYEKWKDVGSVEELFGYFKQLWHTVAYFG